MQEVSRRSLSGSTSVKTTDTSSACVSPCRATWPLQRTAPRPESPPRAAQARSPPGCATFRSAQQRIAVLHRRAWSNPPTGSSSGPRREERSCRRTCQKRATCPQSCGCRRRTCPSDKPGLRAAVQQKLASVGLVGWTPYPGFAPGNRLLSAHPRTSSTGTVRREVPPIGVVNWVISPVTDRSGIRH